MISTTKSSQAQRDIKIRQYPMQGVSDKVNKKIKIGHIEPYNGLLKSVCAVCICLNQK